MDFLSTEQAANEVGITRQAMLLNIKAGNIKASRVGRAFVIRFSDVLKFKRERRGKGRPKGKQKRR